MPYLNEQNNCPGGIIAPLVFFEKKIFDLKNMKKKIEQKMSVLIIVFDSECWNVISETFLNSRNNCPPSFFLRKMRFLRETRGGNYSAHWGRLLQLFNSYMFWHPTTFQILELLKSYNFWNPTDLREMIPTLTYCI